jgi:hypothetical protein
MQNAEVKRTFCTLPFVFIKQPARAAIEIASAGPRNDNGAGSWKWEFQVTGLMFQVVGFQST